MFLLKEARTNMAHTPGAPNCPHPTPRSTLPGAPSRAAPHTTPRSSVRDASCHLGRSGLPDVFLLRLRTRTYVVTVGKSQPCVLLWYHGVDSLCATTAKRTEGAINCRRYSTWLSLAHRHDNNWYYVHRNLRRRKQKQHFY